MAPSLKNSIFSLLLGGVLVVIFLICEVTTTTLPPETQSYTPIFTLEMSPLEKSLLIDYPEKFSLADRISNEFGDSIWQKSYLTEKEHQDLSHFVKTPFWQGLVPFLVEPPIFPLDAIFLEKVQQGEVYRLLTPVFLHAGIYHLFFNLTWVLVLLRAFEISFGRKNFLKTFLLFAIVSNLSQYIVSGPFFIGISGVISGYVGFFFSWQKRIQTDLYPLPRAVFRFLIGSILVFTGIEILFLLGRNLFALPLAFPIANTAHLSGLFTGWVYGKIASDSVYFGILDE